jgi:CheY-like chemotaxis protein
LDNSISSQITSPISAQDLSSVLIFALESNTVSPISTPNDIIFDILLTEDNLVNQKPAIKILRKYGHTVKIVENGSLVFKGRVTQSKLFDIILIFIYFSFHFHATTDKYTCTQMDVSMPLMGGMEVTELIRSYKMHQGITIMYSDGHFPGMLAPIYFVHIMIICIPYYPVPLLSFTQPGFNIISLPYQHVRCACKHSKLSVISYLPICGK